MTSLKLLQEEFKNELFALLEWWSNYTIDNKNGGFYGKIDNHNNHYGNSPKGLVLNTRILYTFAISFQYTKNEKYKAIATRAFDYLCDYFYDKEYFGFFWSLNTDGSVLDSKKQVYGQAFSIYSLAEYYKISNNNKALELAITTYHLIEKYSLDKINTGYIEAHNRQWQETDDLRLSEKDMNEKKSMNTHLHIIEAYANLYSIYPNIQVKKSIENLLDNFSKYIINPKNYHLNLFFTENWQTKSSIFSFGHDIEAAWLLLEAAEIIDKKEEIDKFKKIAIKLTIAALEAKQINGGLLYEFNTETNHWISEYHWWPQAEAMVGLLNAYQISRKTEFLNHLNDVWSFIKLNLKDNKNGEWFWGCDSDLNILPNEDKAGFWKCPYHNIRALIELIKRSNPLITPQ